MDMFLAQKRKKWSVSG